MQESKENLHCTRDVNATVTSCSYHGAAVPGRQHKLAEINRPGVVLIEDSGAREARAECGGTGGRQKHCEILELGERRQAGSCSAIHEQLRVSVGRWNRGKVRRGRASRVEKLQYRNF